MRILTFRYPKNTVTDILLSLLCIFIITLIIQSDQVNKTTAVFCVSSYDRIGFLYRYGWEVDINSEEKSYIILPKKFDEVFAEYNRLQISQGFDLSLYLGKKLEKYTYLLKNTDYFADETYCYATVLIYDNKIVGADIYSPSIDGIMIGVVTD